MLLTVGWHSCRVQVACLRMCLAGHSVLMRVRPRAKGSRLQCCESSGAEKFGRSAADSWHQCGPLAASEQIEFDPRQVEVAAQLVWKTQKQQQDRVSSLQLKCVAYSSIAVGVRGS